MQKKTKPKQPQAAVILTIALLAAVAFALVIAFIVSSAAADDVSSSVSGQSYAAEVAAALEGSDAFIGEALIADQDCIACHVLGDGAVAPLFAGIADRAAEQRPPLSAEQYLYEAIMYPGAYVLEGYANSMPNHYSQRLSQQEIGHIIAYLLTAADEAVDSQN